LKRKGRNALKRQATYSVYAKRCAQRIVHEAFDEILCGDYKMLSHRQMEKHLEHLVDYPFDEYEFMKRIIIKNPTWDEKQVSDELYRIKLRYNREYQENLRQAAAEAIEEIENLSKSLHDTIKAWKIKNIEIK